MSTAFHTLLLREVKIFFAPLAAAAQDPVELHSLLSMTGWDLQRTLGTQYDLFLTGFEAAQEVYDALDALSAEDDLGLEEIVEFLEAGEAVVQLVETAQNGLAPLDVSEFSEFPGDLMGTLLSLYLSNRVPALFRLLELLTIVQEDDRSPISDGDEVYRGASLVPRVDLGRLADLFSNPADLLASAYWPDGMPDQDTADEVADRIFPKVASFLYPLGIQAVAGWDGEMGSLDPDVAARLQHALGIRFRFFLSSLSTLVNVGATFGLLPATEGGPGVYAIPFGELSFEQEIGNWTLSISADSDLPGFAITGSGFELYADDAFSPSISLSLEPENGEDPDFVLGNPQGSRLEVQTFRINAYLSANGADPDYGFSLELLDGALVIAPGDGDGFIAKILPADGLTTTFDLTIGWSKSKGFHFEGAAGFDLTIPVYQTLLGFLSLDTIRLGLSANGTDISATASVSGGLALGPFTATVSEVGMEVNLSFPEGGGNLGPVQFDLGFKPPEGIGISVDASVVKGGGYLRLEPENHRYSGSLELTISEVISLKAIGILNTRMPDGSEGYALLLLVTAEFAPVQLGMGFTLNGVGGLFGAHRTMLIDPLKEGVRTGSIDNLLFPDDPVGDANAIIADLESVFPIREGQFVFGPMGILGWGTPTLVELKMGLVISLPDPVSLAILGVLSMVLPDEDLAIATIKVSFVGAIDFDKGELSFDASLFGSKILTWTLSGDMAVRLGWGDRPNFILSVGGFHPDFDPPADDLAGMERLTINLLSGDNPRLTLSSYFALTSNSFQFGASIDFYYKCTKNIYVSGYLGFDALFQFSPFWFKIAVGASLAVMNKNKALLSIYVGGSLEGPTPWRVQGTAEFKVLGIKIKVKIDETFGERDSTTFPDVDVTSKLVEAIRDSRNWLASKADGTQTVTFASMDTAEDELIAYPNGKVGLSQKVVPLNLRIDLFGNQKPRESTPKWSLELYDNGGSQLDHASSKEYFAPAQFFDKSENQKVKGASFEQFEAGIEAQTGSELQGNYFLEREVEYETNILDEVKLRLSNKGLSQAFGQGLLRGGSSSKSSLGKYSRLSSPLGPAKTSLPEDSFAVVSSADLSIYQNLTASSGTEAELMLAEVVRQNPKLKSELQVIPATEIELL